MPTWIATFHPPPSSLLRWFPRHTWFLKLQLHEARLAIYITYLIPVIVSWWTQVIKWACTPHRFQIVMLPVVKCFHVFLLDLVDASILLSTLMWYNPTQILVDHSCKDNSLCQSKENWLVVSTQLKNISQNGNLPQVGVKIKNIWNHHQENDGWAQHRANELKALHWLTDLFTRSDKDNAIFGWRFWFYR